MNPKQVQDNPPKNVVESEAQLQNNIESKELTPEQIQEQITAQEQKRAEEKAKIEALSEETTLLAQEKQEQELVKEDRRVVSVPKQSSGKRPFFAKAAMILGFLGLTSMGAAQNKSAESMASKDPEAKTRVISKETKAQGLKFYDGGITAEGRRTPTGKLNSFESSGYIENQVYEFAEEYGLRTTSNKDFQTDLFAIPGIADSVLAEFGQTKAGTLIDGKLGARVGFAMKKLEKQKSGGDINIEPAPKTPPEIDPNPGFDTIPSPEKPPSLLETFDELYIYFDLSPSMKENQKKLAEELRSLNRDKPVTIIGFTDQPDTTFSSENTNQAADTLESINLIDKNTELAIDVLLKTLPEKQFNKELKNVILISTDESLQKVTKEKLMNLEKIGTEKGLTVQFRMMVRGKVKEFSLGQIQTMYEDNYGRNLPTANVNITGYENEYKK